MATKNVSFRINENLKIKADEVLKDIGLNMTSALTMFLQQVVNKHAIPFIPEGSDTFYSKLNQERLTERIKQYNEDEFTEHELITVD